ncbi:hypothetical protein ED562_13735 [Microcystis aeruginosa FACHB-524]|uniref:tyrosine-type recombinase/integrase n=1 Tax=Microcystis aeruginosa TaxID=1126 RepID=UPI000F4496A1|nr:tyrosine-type recombinase/integrase [Microcystis aeruginosa]ROI01686.1 hypothetical protein ED562_13735 [Microcystis aeruginosa FACHB-524]
MLIFNSKAVVERRGFRPKFSMSNRGVPLRVIQKISGHSSLEVLQRYLEVSDEQIGAAVGLLV